MDMTSPNSATYPVAPSSASACPPLSFCVVFPDDLAGLAFTLQGELVVGRLPGVNTAQLAQRTVSGRHAQFIAGNGYWLNDLGSTNGTKVNGTRISQHTYLPPQAVVRFGDVIGIVDEPVEVRFAQNEALPGTHLAHSRIRERLPRAAGDSAPVLIVGETGTGKERLALEVHRLSARRGNYVPVNCAEFSAQLIESQLFGHERGAFTGATTAQTGLFEAAQGGTLFLDEIGELPLDLQPKLLRVLQEGEIRPVGSVRTRTVDVRVVAATNRNLPQMVEQGSFRRDLHARLSLWDLELPPLRKARQDVLPWIQRLLSAWARERSVEATLAFLPDAAEAILLHDWPDNLRGLNRMVHRLASSTPGRPIGMRALREAMPELFDSVTSCSAASPAPERAANVSSSAPPAPGNAKPTVRPSRAELLAVYEGNGCNIRATSKHFGKDRRQIYRWLEQFEIPRRPDKDD